MSSTAGERLALSSGAVELSAPLLPRALAEATLTLTQNRRVMKETTMRENRRNMRNQALQCSQLLSPIMRMYSCEWETASRPGRYPVCMLLAFPQSPSVRPVCLHTYSATYRKVDQETWAVGHRQESSSTRGEREGCGLACLSPTALSPVVYRSSSCLSFISGTCYPVWEAIPDSQLIALSS